MDEHLPVLSNRPVSELTYEQALTELESIVASLEANDQNLATSLELFQRGQELVKYCSSQLEQAELIVQQVSGDRLEKFPGE